VDLQRVRFIDTGIDADALGNMLGGGERQKRIHAFCSGY
jgi:hypothetical protein